MINSNPKYPFIPALVSGLLVGITDALSAVVSTSIQYHKDPEFVFKYVASGFFGKEALKGGPDMTLWGLLFHFIIAISCALVFFWLYPRVKLMWANWVATGIVYALLVWVVTNLVIVQLSNTPKGPFHAKGIIIGMLILIVAIGLPLAHIAKSHYSKKVVIH